MVDEKEDLIMIIGFFALAFTIYPFTKDLIVEDIPKKYQIILAYFLAVGIAFFLILIYLKLKNKPQDRDMCLDFSIRLKK